MDQGSARTITPHGIPATKQKFVFFNELFPCHAPLDIHYASEKTKALTNFANRSLTKLELLRTMLLAWLSDTKNKADLFCFEFVIAVAVYIKNFLNSKIHSGDPLKSPRE